MPDNFCWDQTKLRPDMSNSNLQHSNFNNRCRGSHNYVLAFVFSISRFPGGLDSSRGANCFGTWAPRTLLSWPFLPLLPVGVELIGCPVVLELFAGLDSSLTSCLPASEPPPQMDLIRWPDSILCHNAHKYAVRSTAMTHCYFRDHDTKILKTTCVR